MIVEQIYAIGSGNDTTKNNVKNNNIKENSGMDRETFNKEAKKFKRNELEKAISKMKKSFNYENRINNWKTLNSTIVAGKKYLVTVCVTDVPAIEPYVKISKFNPALENCWENIEKHEKVIGFMELPEPMKINSNEPKCRCIPSEILEGMVSADEIENIKISLRNKRSGEISRLAVVYKHNNSEVKTIGVTNGLILLRYSKQIDLKVTSPDSYNTKETIYFYNKENGFNKDLIFFDKNGNNVTDRIFNRINRELCNNWIDSEGFKIEKRTSLSEEDIESINALCDFIESIF